MTQVTSQALQSRERNDRKKESSDDCRKLASNRIQHYKNGKQGLVYWQLWH